MEFFGYVGAVIIGLTLGILGSGGSILTVPVLVYLLHFNPIVATGYSLFIVGLTSLTGAFSYMRKDLVDYRTAIAFALPSFVSVYSVRRFLLPLIPRIVYLHATGQRAGRRDGCDAAHHRRRGGT